MKLSIFPRKKRQEEVTRGHREHRKGTGEDGCCHLWHTHYVPEALLSSAHASPDMSLFKALITPFDLAPGRL